MNTRLDQRGFEIPDQTPVAVPAYIKKYDQRDTIKELIRQALSQEAHNAGYETFEEADDFDVGDDYDPTSPYEECFDPDTGVSLWDQPADDLQLGAGGPEGESPSPVPQPPGGDETPPGDQVTT